MHPLEKFEYCPRCGSHHFVENGARSRKCENCGFEYFMNPSAANVAIIRNSKGEILVTLRKQEPAKGTLDLPGGFTEIGETSEEGVVREVMEETNLKVTAARYLFSLPTYIAIVASNCLRSTCSTSVTWKTSRCSPPTTTLRSACG